MKQRTRPGTRAAERRASLGLGREFRPAERCSALRRLRWFLPLILFTMLPASRTFAETNPPPVVATFSIVGFDPATGDLGVAVQSKFFGVGSVVPWAKAKVGAIATQSYANPNYGPDGLALLQSGKSAEATLKQLTEADARRAVRQAGIIDARGYAAGFTGANCQPWAGHRVGTNFCAQGNILAGPQVVEDMAKAFESARASGGALADWLMAALAAGQKAGGDKRGQQSAALLVVRDQGGYDRANDRFIDLRVEDHPEPITELTRLLELHKKVWAGAHRRVPKQ